MSLSPPVPREPFHARNIRCQGWRRHDGDWDVEGHMLDTKPFDYDEPVRGHREAGSPVHEISIRLTIDDQLVVKAIEVSLAAVPYTACPGAAAAFQGLVGSRIGGSWRRTVNEIVGGTSGCTHARELLFPIATVAFQTVHGWRPELPQLHPVESTGERPFFIDACRSWAADGEMVARFYPRHAGKRA